MLVWQMQSHYGDTTPASELGLTVRIAAVRETDLRIAAAVCLSSSKAAERDREKTSCETK